MKKKLALGFLLAALSLVFAAKAYAVTFTDGRNPVAYWSPSRIDDGVDGTLSSYGARAPFEMYITRSYDHYSGWAMAVWSQAGS